MQNMTIDLLGSSRDHTFYGPSKGPISGPRIEGPHSAGGSTQVQKDHIGTMVMFYIRSLYTYFIGKFLI